MGGGYRYLLRASDVRADNTCVIEVRKRSVVQHCFVKPVGHSEKTPHEYDDPENDGANSNTEHFNWSNSNKATILEGPNKLGHREH
jgi:hypothetical protein